MSGKNLKSSANKGKSDQIESLLSALERVEKKIETSIDAETSFVTIFEYEKNYRVIATKINALYAKLGISDRIKEEYKSDTARHRKNFAYREEKNEIEAIGGKDSIFEDSNAFLLGAQIQNTPIISRQNKGGIPPLNFEQLKFDDSITKPYAASAPRAVEIEEFRPVKFDTQTECFKYIEQEITREISPAYVESFLEDEKNFSDFVGTVRRGFQLPYIYQVVGDKILGFVQKREEELVDQTRDETSLLTA